MKLGNLKSISFGDDFSQSNQKKSFSGAALSCVQCSSLESPHCLEYPPAPTTCHKEAKYCLTLKEYQPSRQGRTNFVLKCNHAKGNVLRGLFELC